MLRAGLCSWLGCAQGWVVLRAGLCSGLGCAQDWGCAPSSMVRKPFDLVAPDPLCASQCSTSSLAPCQSQAMSCFRDSTKAATESPSLGAEWISTARTGVQPRGRVRVRPSGSGSLRLAPVSSHCVNFCTPMQPYSFGIGRIGRTGRIGRIGLGFGRQASSRLRLQPASMQPSLLVFHRPTAFRASAA